MLDPSFQSNVSQLMKSLPRPVRLFLQEGKHSPIAKQLTEKYGLHIDQGAILESQLILLLLGVDEPPVFATALEAKGKIPKEVIIKIITDLDREIFAPLQKQVFDAERDPMQTVPAPTNIQPKESPTPTAHSGGEHLLADHEEPHITVAGEPHWRVGSIPDAPKAPPPAPRPAPNLPRYGVFTPNPAPKVRPVTQQTVSTAPPVPPSKPVPPPQPKAPIIDTYTLDPYREPRE